MPYSMMQTSLPMYDLPEIRVMTQTWWQGIAKHMRLQDIEDVPDFLIREVPLHTLWTERNLLLSQCCGFDVMNSYKDHLSVLMISNWDVAGCATGQYYSHIIVPEDSDFKHIGDLKNSTAAINGLESHSGMNALLSTVQPFVENGRFFKTIQVSGAHVESLRFVQDKLADVAAIDCVTYALLKRYRPAILDKIRILSNTKPAPALPYVTSINTTLGTQQRMQAALKAAFQDPDLASVRKKLLLKEGIFPDLSSSSHPYFTRENPYRKIAEGFTFDPQLLESMILREEY